MTRKLRKLGRLPLHGLLLALASCVISGAPAGAGETASCGAPGCQGHTRTTGGFQGFGLGCRLGYGYGGDGLGVGPYGGYPFYGGPGYPHPEPQLRRLHRIVPFAYYGGPGQPTPCEPHYFGGVGPLVVDPPVVTVDGDAGSADFGPYSGAIPYPDSLFTPFPSQETVAPGEARPASPGAPSTSEPPLSAPAPGVQTQRRQGTLFADPGAARASLPRRAAGRDAAR